MSRKMYTIDKTLYDILVGKPGGTFTLGGLRPEYSERSGELELPPNKYLFWMIFMQIYSLRAAKMVRREERPGEPTQFFLEDSFRIHPFEKVEGLFTKRWFRE